MITSQNIREKILYHFVPLQGPIKRLPGETLIEIFQKLNSLDLESTALVSKHWQHLGDSNTVWQEIIKNELPHMFQIAINIPLKEQFKVAIQGRINLVSNNLNLQLDDNFNKGQALFDEKFKAAFTSEKNCRTKNLQITKFINDLEFITASCCDKILLFAYVCQMSSLDEYGEYATNIKALKILLSLGANPNMQFNDHLLPNPLFQAILSKNVEIIKILIELGADPTFVNSQGDNMWDIAQRENLPSAKIEELKIYVKNKLAEKGIDAFANGYLSPKLESLPAFGDVAARITFFAIEQKIIESSATKCFNYVKEKLIKKTKNAIQYGIIQQHQKERFIEDQTDYIIQKIIKHRHKF